MLWFPACLRLICLLREVKKLPGKDSCNILLSFLIFGLFKLKILTKVQTGGKALWNKNYFLTCTLNHFSRKDFATYAFSIKCSQTFECVFSCILREIRLFIITLPSWLQWFSSNKLLWPGPHCRRNVKTQQSTVILDLSLSKTRAGK